MELALGFSEDTALEAFLLTLVLSDDLEIDLSFSLSFTLLEYIKLDNRLIRPCNFSEGTPGNGYAIFEMKNGENIVIIIVFWTYADNWHLNVEVWHFEVWDEYQQVRKVDSYKNYLGKNNGSLMVESS